MLGNWKFCMGNSAESIPIIQKLYCSSLIYCNSTGCHCLVGRACMYNCGNIIECRLFYIISIELCGRQNITWFVVSTFKYFWSSIMHSHPISAKCRRAWIKQNNKKYASVFVSYYYRRKGRAVEIWNTECNYVISQSISVISNILRK